MNKVAKNVNSPQEGADIFRQGISSLKNAAVEARRIKAAPLYEKAVRATNRLRPQVVEDLKNFKTKTGTTNPAIGQTIADLREARRDRETGTKDAYIDLEAI